MSASIIGTSTGRSFSLSTITSIFILDMDIIISKILLIEIEKTIIENLEYWRQNI